MMILKHSGQAPRRFPHLIHGMSHFEMSGHDTKVGSFDLILPPNQIPCVHCIKNILEDFSKLPRLLCTLQPGLVKCPPMT